MFEGGIIVEKQDKINLILDLQDNQDWSFDQIMKKLWEDGIYNGKALNNIKDAARRFMKNQGYKYNKTTQKFEPGENAKPPIVKTIIKQEKDLSVIENQFSMNVVKIIKQEKDLVTFKYLIENGDKIKELLENNQQTENEDIIDAVHGLDIGDEFMKPKASNRTIRLTDKIVKGIDQLANENPKYSKTVIYNFLLTEGLKKYLHDFE